MKKKSDFTRHIAGIILLGTLVPLMISLFLTVLYNRYELKRETVALQLQRLSYISQHIDNLFSSIKDSMRSLSSHEDLQLLFSEDGGGEDQSERIGGILADLCYVYPTYSNAYICSAVNRKIYSAYPETGGVISYDALSSTDWYADTLRQYRYEISLYPFSQGSYIACVQPEHDPVTLEFKGYYMVKIKTSAVDEFFRSYSDSTAVLACITPDGTVIAAQWESQDVDFSQIAATIAGGAGSSFDYAGYTICHAPLSDSNFLILSLIPKNAQTAQSLVPGMFGVILAILCTAVGLSFTISYLRQFLLPIHQLAQIMQNADLDNLTPVSLTKRDDEIAVLESGYNDMVENFNRLLDREYKTSLAMQDAQIKSLQLQINPHFVNNTLQMIGSIAVERDCMDIYELLQSFSSMFYYCLKYKGDMVVMQDELDYLKHYLKIQSKRYPDRFDVSIQADAAISDCEIPKMILQPVVENCFAHAFSLVDGRWHIQITAEYTQGECRICIADNGHGMTESDLQKLQKQIRTTEATVQLPQSNSIGLRNVNTRLRLLYGEAYQLSITSTVGVGTSVTIRVPQKMKGEPSHDYAPDR